MSDYALEFRNISKAFPGVIALNNINFGIKSAEIHVLVGENGAGKSTLLKILSGVYPYGSYEGSFHLFGKEARFTNIKNSEDLGIAIIYQELALVKEMSIAENIFLGNERLNDYGTIDWEKTEKDANYYLKEVGLDVNPLVSVINLGVGQQQLVAIAKALSKNAKILLVDEPTAALTEKETEHLIEILKSLKAKGVTIIFITHKLKEVFDCADRVTILRDGNYICTDLIKDLTMDDIISGMVGRKITNRFPKISSEKGEIVMEVRNWTLKDPDIPDRKLVDNVSFSLRRGEVLGFAGLIGAGRTELVTSLFGCYPGYTSGELFIERNSIQVRNPNQAIMNGISYVPEDRKRYGLNLIMSIQDNVTIASLDKISKFNVIDNIKKLLVTIKTVQDMKIKTSSVDTMAAYLSGGNQQKVVIGKWLLTKPKVLILDEPTRGIDVGAKLEIYHIINELVKDGVGIIMISSELPEVLGMSDRVLVINQGKIAAEFDNPGEVTQEEIMQYATGGQT